MDSFDQGERELSQVNCLQDIVEAINGIAVQLGASSSSSGCGCAYGSDTNITDLSDVDSEDVPTGEEFPPGFSDRPEYDSYRCKAATKIFDDYLATLRNWGGLSGLVGGLTVAVMIGLSLLTIPPLGLTILLAALGTIFATDVALFVNLTLIANNLDENRDSIICDIYNSETTEEAVSVLRDAATLVVVELELTGLEATFLAVTNNLISNEAMSVLIVKDEAINALPEADCSDCNPSEVLMVIDVTICVAEIIAGDFTEGVETTVDSCVGNYFGSSRAGHNLAVAPGFAGPNRRVTITGTSGSAASTVFVILVDDGVPDAGEEYTLAELLTVDWEINGLQVCRTAPGNTDDFTITYVVEEL
jgi:hypothetical protein